MPEAFCRCFHFCQTGVVVGKFRQVRQSNLPGEQRVIVGNVGRRADGAMLQFNPQPGAELSVIKPFPPDAQFFADCLRLNQGKCGFAHETKRLAGNTEARDGVFTSLEHSFIPTPFHPGLVPPLAGKIDS